MLLLFPPPGKKTESFDQSFTEMVTGWRTNPLGLVEGRFHGELTDDEYRNQEKNNRSFLLATLALVGLVFRLA